MKKTLNRSVLALVLAAICVLCPACKVEDKADDSSYMKVYGDNSTLSDSSSIFVESVYKHSGDYVHYVDESAPQKISETIFGVEFEMAYERTMTIRGEPWDWYKSIDGLYTVQYKKATGELKAVFNNQVEELPEELCCTEDEMIDVAIRFAKSKWALLQDNCYTLDSVEKRGSANDFCVAFRRTVNGIETSEIVVVLVDQSGEVVGWIDYLRYPNGIPNDMFKAASEVDMDLCRSSVEHYIEECAIAASVKNIVILDFNNTGRFDMEHDGTLSWQTAVLISIVSPK